jgi:hypothetical protein
LQDRVHLATCGLLQSFVIGVFHFIFTKLRFDQHHMRISTDALAADIDPRTMHASREVLSYCEPVGR